MYEDPNEQVPEPKTGSQVGTPAASQIIEPPQIQQPTPVSAPSSAYALFMKSLKHNEEFQASLTDKKNFLSHASKRWKEMTELDRQPFQAQHDRLREEFDLYQKELFKFKQQNQGADGAEYID